MSKFKDLLNAAHDRESEPQSVEPSPKPARKKGRPKGKRSNPDYEQVTAYVKRETYRKVKIALLQQEQGQDFSELVENLLSEWLSTQKSNNSSS